MLNESETLDAVFSFLSQVDLPRDFDDGEHAILDAHETLSPRSAEFLTSVVAENWAFGNLCPEQSNTPSNPSQAESAIHANEVGEIGREYSQSIQITSPTSTEESNQSSKGETRNRKLKRTRISSKQQIQTLRETVRGLNAELQSLLPKSQPNCVALHRSVAGHLISERASMWQQIAARQLERRQQSEEENAKLREMLQVQVDEARNLKRVLKRRTKLDVYSDMLLDVDELYVGTEALFTEKGMRDLPCPGRVCDAKRNVTNGLFLELMQRHLIPFGLKTTEKAMYKAMREIGFQGLRNVEDVAGRVQFHSHRIEDTNNTIKASFFVETPKLKDLRGAQFRKVVQKYVEKDRVVFICKTLMEPVLSKTGKTSESHTRTTLRIVLQPDDSQSAREKPVTRIESHFSATRYDMELLSATVTSMSPNMDVGLAAWAEAISRIAHQVESLAIDESCDKLKSRVGARV
ncbi:unnamed protein product [Phytophthora fragariaefolia]|uniref:Unnamed protein product n=1 Tax=Phytophthora fragariaefolia TaxID=1490495 RepID=A0A9W6Y0Q5_9STRA|nr:unnamed protein product [Phytophthora fragariaefolia]